MDLLIVGVILVLFFSTLVRSTFGFGDALIAMPLLAMMIGVKTATPVVAIYAIIIGIVILWSEFRKIDWRSVWQLIFFSILGIPLGVLFLKGAGEQLIKIILGLLLISFSLYSLFKPGLIQIKNDKFAFMFGIISGILGGAYNTNGPPIIIYGAMRRWKPDYFRAILQGVFFPTNCFIVMGHGLAGLWTPEVIKLCLITMPFALLAIYAGTKLNKILPREKFTTYIYYMLIILGLILLVSVIPF